MSRGLTPATITHLNNNSDSLRMITLVKMYFTDAGSNMTDYGSRIDADITGAVETYAPTEFIIEFGEVSESSVLHVGDMDLTLTAADKTYLNYALADAYFNTRVVVARAFVNDTVSSSGGAYEVTGGTIIGSPWTLFDGRIRNYGLDERGDDSEVTFNITSHWVDFEKVNCRRTNKASQQRYFPTDSGMNWAADAIKELRWGRKDLDAG